MLLEGNEFTSQGPEQDLNIPQLISTLELESVLLVSKSSNVP